MNYKLTDREFWSILRENGGLFARTAREIQSKYKVAYSRQAVQRRATATLKAKDELNDIIEETLDIAEEGLFKLIRTAQPNVQLDAIKYFLKLKGKDRGYGDKPLEITSKANTVKGKDHLNEVEGLKLYIRVLGPND